MNVSFCKLREGVGYCGMCILEVEEAPETLATVGIRETIGVDEGIATRGREEGREETSAKFFSGMVRSNDTHSLTRTKVTGST